MRPARRRPSVLGAGFAASSIVLVATARPVAAAAATPLALARRLVHSLAAAPPAARLSLPVEHQALLAAVGAFLTTAAGIEALGRVRRRRRRSRSARHAVGPCLDVASAAGTRTLSLERARAHAVEDGEGRLVAQVVWSRELGWCAQASWPHFLYGPEGLPRHTAALADGEWLHVAGVGLRLRTGAAQGRDGRLAARAL